MEKIKVGIRCGACLSETFSLSVFVTEEEIGDTTIECSECGKAFGDFDVSFEEETTQ